MTVPGTLLAIETSCDETSAAVLRRGAAGPALASCVILSQDAKKRQAAWEVLKFWTGPIGASIVNASSRACVEIRMTST